MATAKTTRPYVIGPPFICDVFVSQMMLIWVLQQKSQHVPFVGHDKVKKIVLQF